MKRIKLKESDIKRIVKRVIKESPEDAPFGWYGSGNSEEGKEEGDKEEWKDKLHQRLWQAIEDIDEERETQAAVKLSTEDVVDVLESMINSLDPIEDNYDEESGAWFGQNL